MASKMCNLYLDEDVIEGLDELAKKMGLSRSRVANMTLKTAVGGQSLHDFTKWLFSNIDEGKEDEENHLVTAN